MTTKGEPVLRVEGVWKKFSRDLMRSRHHGIRAIADEARVRSGPARVPHLAPDEFWALRDVDLTVEPGESVGLLGANGAGKSTLLRIIAGISPPDRGLLTLSGRARALLDPLGSLDPMLTGRENITDAFGIWNSGRELTPAKRDAIIDFAELGDFIDAPVRTYSSGMRMRLGFAVLIHLNARLMLIDEALVVGDAGFQRRCLTSLRQYCRRGGALVFVTHSLALFNVLATRAIYLQEGVVVDAGDPREVARSYLRDLLAESGPATAASDPLLREAGSLLDVEAVASPDTTDENAQGDDDASAPSSLDSRPVRIVGLRTSSAGSAALCTGMPGRITLDLVVDRTVQRWQAGVTFWTADLLVCLLGIMVNSTEESGELDEGLHQLDFKVPRIDLLPGTYACRLVVFDQATTDLVGELGFDTLPEMIEVEPGVPVDIPPLLQAGQPATVLDASTALIRHHPTAHS